LSIPPAPVRRVSRRDIDKEIQMRFMMLVKSTPEIESTQMPTREMVDEMGRYNQSLARAGVLLAADGLYPSSKGVKITFGENGRTTATDGPFTEAKELVAAYWLIQVSSRQEAVQWASRVPFGEGGEIELRQVFEADDFQDTIAG
jgi:hypothetical protein